MEFGGRGGGEPMEKGILYVFQQWLIPSFSPTPSFQWTDRLKLTGSKHAKNTTNRIQKFLLSSKQTMKQNQSTTITCQQKLQKNKIICEQAC